MPKRSCPFAESFSSQYKIHVGQKELSNSGVLGNIYRQEIFDKTKTLLFSGARAVMGKLWNVEVDYSKCPDPQLEARTSTTAGTQPLLRGQTLIGPDGRLRRTTACHGVPFSVGPAACCVCRQPPRSAQRCSQCDRQACSSCARLCSACVMVCCSVCTTVDYSEQYDQVICCSCSS